MEQKVTGQNYFHEMTLAALFTIHVNLHAMEFPLIFGETNFVEVPNLQNLWSSKHFYTHFYKKIPCHLYYNYVLHSLIHCNKATPSYTLLSGHPPMCKI